MKTLKEKHAELCEIIGKGEVMRLLHNWYDRAIRREKARKNSDDPEDFERVCRRILDDLWAQTGAKYRLGKETRSLIRARMNDGYTELDFQHVHSVKTKQWLDDERFRLYLVPGTLYRQKNFPKYLAQWQMNASLEQKQRRQREENQRRRGLSTTQQSQPQPKPGEERKMTPEEAAEARKAVQSLLAKLGKKRMK